MYQNGKLKGEAAVSAMLSRASPAPHRRNSEPLRLEQGRTVLSECGILCLIES